MNYQEWTFAKREEARKLHLTSYRLWIDGGCEPVPVYAINPRSPPAAFPPAPVAA